jgi:hypothetical protein
MRDLGAVAAMVSLAVVSILASCGQSEPKAPPVLSWTLWADDRLVDEALPGLFDLGTVLPRAPLLLRLEAVGPPDLPISIARVHSGCGCFDWKPDGPVDSHGRGQVRLTSTLDVRGFDAQAFSRDVQVELAGAGVKWSRSLQLRFKVVTTMRVPREPLDFGSVPANTAASASLTIDGGEDPWTVQAVEWHGGIHSAEPPQFHVDEQPASGRRKLHIKLVAPALTGAQDLALRVTTTNPDVPEFVLNCKVTVSGGLSVVPPRALLGRCARGEPGRAMHVVIRNAGRLELQGIEPTSRSDLVRIELHEGPPGDWRVAIGYSGASGPGGRQALTVVLTCSAVPGGVIRLPVEMVVD